MQIIFILPSYFFFLKCLFIYLFWLHWVLVVACRLSCSMHVGCNSLTRDWTQGPLHWECRVLPTGPPGRSLLHISYLKCQLLHISYLKVGRKPFKNVLGVKQYSIIWGWMSSSSKPLLLSHNVAAILVMISTLM